jgi:hypothetical protein
MSNRLTPEQAQLILSFAERYAKAHWEVDELAVHLSVDEQGALEMDGEDSYLVCLDMPGIGDIQRIVVIFNDEDGTVERDHTYSDDADCAACQHGHRREYLPGDAEESE